MIFRYFKSRVLFSVFLLLLIIVVGTFGYVLIAEVSWLDALYMTIITISTVGYTESVPLDGYTRLFTICLIVTSLLLTAFIISSLTEYLLNNYSLGKLKKKAMKAEIKNLNNHVILCGFGRNGQQAYEKLNTYNKEVVIIDSDANLSSEFVEKDILHVEGDATEDEILIHAGVKNASHLICALSEDAQNLYVVLSARQLCAKLKIISRATSLSAYKKIKLAGANNVILPESLGGDHLASLVVTPDLLDFFNNLSISDGDTENVRELPFSTLCSDGKPKKIIDLNINNETGCNVIGAKRKDGSFYVNPEDDFEIEEGTHLIIIGNTKQIKRLKSKFDLNY